MITLLYEKEAVICCCAGLCPTENSRYVSCRGGILKIVRNKTSNGWGKLACHRRNGFPSSVTYASGGTRLESF